MTAIQYTLPSAWIKYDKTEIFQEITDAKAAVLALKSIPFQRRWVEELQKIQLKMEISGTSKIEGADFAANELDVAIRAESPEQLRTRSQKQANAAVRTYKLVATIPDDVPIDLALIRQLHRLIVADCDDDHCPPGVIRGKDQNVSFGNPKHRGAIGGKECEEAFRRLTKQVQTAFKEHDLLIQALALHYHFAAIHPFLDGNGRTARVLEALVLQRAGLKDSLFIAMSNYYYDEKKAYLDALAAVRARNQDLTPFLKFGLRGVALQSNRLAEMIKNEVSRQIFRNLMHELFTRLESTRKRVIVKRQLALLEKLLNADGRVEFLGLTESVKSDYSSRKAPLPAIVRDINRLQALGALRVEKEEPDPKNPIYYISVRLDWPSTITETEFFGRLAALPKSKTYGFLSPDES
ncbi:MAG TPA: Fic family protein [Candidatus Acidoferrales bacterium]